MDIKKPRRKLTLPEVLPFLFPVMLGVALALVDPRRIIAQDWTPEFTDKLLFLLPFYFAGCLAAAAGMVITSLRRFPKHVVPTTVVATVVVLSGTLVPLKVFRDGEARQARVTEADMLADSILSLTILAPDTLPDAARAEVRKISVSMFGEEMLGPDFMKPAVKAEVTQ